jgi:glycosyltransferase involved in cell wall biosynthesis
MSAGAVPVVVNAGGQREPVTHGTTGFLWDHPNDLKASTRQLASDAALRQQMGERAISASRRFSRAEFVHRVEGIVRRLLGTPHPSEPPA